MLLVNAPGPLVCEAEEAIPAFDCPSCDGVEARGQSREACHRCGGSRRIGVEGELPEGVALDDFDRGRYFAEGELREAGEALYALHECGEAEVAAA